MDGPRDVWLPTLLGLAIAGVVLRFIPMIIHLGLPGGDSYMTILWAQIMERDLAVPSYIEISRLWSANEAPLSVYFTPLLHSLFFGLKYALGLPYLSLVVASVALVWIAILALFFMIARKVGKLEGVAAIALLGLAGYRTFRYFSTTGFHFQNLFGDLFVVGWLLLALVIVSGAPRLLLRRYSLLLVGAPIVTLPFHQLSAAVVLVVLLVFLLLLLPTLRPQLAVLPKSRYLLLLVPLGLAIFLWFTVPAFSEFVVWMTTVSEFHAEMLIPWGNYGRVLGDALWFAGMLGAGIVVVVLAIEVSRRNRGSGFFLSGKEHRVAILGLSWLAATLLLSRSSELGFNLPPARFLWYATYPLVLMAVLGTSTLIKVLSRVKPSTSGALARLSGGLFAGVVLVVALLSVPIIQPFIDADPPGTSPNDSTYNGETSIVIAYLKENVIPNTTVWYDFRGWKSLVWVMTELIPLGDLSVRALPGSAFFSRRSEENLDAVRESPTGSLIVKSQSTTYNYLEGLDYQVVATSAHLLVLQRLSDPSEIVGIVNLEAADQTAALWGIAGALAALTIPGLVIYTAIWRRRWSNGDSLSAGYAGSFGLSILVISSAGALSLVLGIASPLTIIILVIAVPTVIALSERLLRAFGRPSLQT